MSKNVADEPGRRPADDASTGTKTPPITARFGGRHAVRGGYDARVPAGIQLAILRRRVPPCRRGLHERTGRLAFVYALVPAKRLA